MSKVYNPQWGREMEVDTLLMQRLSRDNFTPVHTGGGCMAWERPTDNGGYLWITDDSGAGLGTWATREDTSWIIGNYNGADDYVCVHSLTLTQALNLANTLRSPVEGEQVTLFFGDK